MADKHPKVSVVIHFLNSANYLPEAINSVIQQTFSDWELVLVDGGSTDNSLEIAESYKNTLPDKVKVLHHEGEDPLGIFSSRVWGAQHAKAQILAHLDSDDEWHPKFLEKQYGVYQHVFATTPGIVYCPVIYWWEDAELPDKSYVQPVPTPGLHKPPDLVVEFLRNHYHKSAANSSVMIARELIIQAASLIGTADEGVVEDQFLWSFLLLKYPVFVNPEPLVHYRQWAGSTCATSVAQDKNLDRRKHHLNWLIQYLQDVYHGKRREDLLQQVKHILALESLDSKKVQSQKFQTSPSAVLHAKVLKKNLRDLLRKYLSEALYLKLRNGYRAIANSCQSSLRKGQKALNRMLPLRGRIQMSFGRKPLSENWGFDRGLPILRYYTEQFLLKFSEDIQGHCLEFQEDLYTFRYGGNRVNTLDILHVDDKNPQATLIGDLTQPNDLPNNAFDCIICTYVLHVIFDLDAAVQTLYRMLKPGGVLLVVVPHISMCDPEWHELWRFTEEGLLRVLAKPFGQENIIMRSYGNSLTAAGNIRGLAAHEFTQTELQAHDARFASEVCARAIKVPAALSLDYEDHQND